MSLAVWLGAVRKCSAAVVGLDLVLGLSMVRRCSLKRSFKRRLCIVNYSGYIGSCRLDYRRHHLSREHYRKKLLALKSELTQKYSNNKSQHC